MNPTASEYQLSTFPLLKPEVCFFLQFCLGSYLGLRTGDIGGKKWETHQQLVGASNSHLPLQSSRYHLLFKALTQLLHVICLNFITVCTKKNKREYGYSIPTLEARTFSASILSPENGNYQWLHSIIALRTRSYYPRKFLSGKMKLYIIFGCFRDFLKIQIFKQKNTHLILIRAMGPFSNWQVIQCIFLLLLLFKACFKTLTSLCSSVPND